jgi:ABC-type multidrug transport system fused ATPase/permease subunit
VICIAHRLHTVAYYDQILVMSNGSVAEFDTPLALIEREDSVFHGMCQSSGAFDQLKALAEEAFNKKVAGSHS